SRQRQFVSPFGSTAIIASLPLLASFRARAEPVLLMRKRSASSFGIQVQAGHRLPRPPEMQIRKVSFGAVCDEHSRRHELPQEKHPAPDEAHGHNRMGFWSLAWIERRHLDHVPGSDIE